MKRVTFLFALAAAALPLETTAAAHGAAARYARLPLSFEANLGQTAPEVRFLSRGAGYTLFLTDSEAVMTLRRSSTPGSAAATAAVRMRLAGARPAPAMEGLEALPGKVNYFRGRDPKGWQTNIPSYAKVAYREVHPGIDLVFYGNQGRLEYDFLVAAGADPRPIRLAFDGADALRLDSHGNLVLTTRAGEIVQQAPVAYQDHGGERRRVRARYSLERGREVGIDVGKYDRRKPLVIDPVLIYSTFLGGSAIDQAHGIAADTSGNAYVAGSTSSPDFPFTVPAVPLGTETFVTKLDTNGQNFIYSTYIGGSFASAIAVDANRRAYVTGGSVVNGFPWTAGAFQTTFGGGNADAFVARLDASGVLDWATFLGGAQYDYGTGIAVNSDGISSVTGVTASIDFPTQSPFQAAHAGGWSDGFAARLDQTGSTLIWSSYLGGTGFDEGQGIAVDPGNNAYVAGFSNSPVVPDSILACKPWGIDVVVVKVDPTGGLVYATCVGGSSTELGRAIAVDYTGNAYVAGQTNSADFPLVNAVQGVKAGLNDSFVFKLDPSGSNLVYSTYVGGSKNEYASGIAVNSGHAYVAGVTYSKDFPLKDSLQGFGGEPLADAFLFKLTPQGSTLVYSTFLGGSDDEDSGGIGTFVAVVRNVAFLAGNTKSKDFALATPMLPSPAQPAHASPGVLDAWVARIQ